MKIHVIRSCEVSIDRFRNIAELLDGQGTPIDFIFEGLTDILTDEHDDPDSVLQPEIRTWNHLFSICREFRLANQIPAEEPVVLLTDHRNERNWFSSGDSEKHFFVQTSGWDHFVEADARYPIVYELITLPLFILSCKDLDEVEERAHRTARGCPFDFCNDKKDVMLRLRTGDICPECREFIRKAGIPRNKIRQIFDVLEKIRVKMLFSERLTLIGPSRLIVDNFNRRLLFPDIDAYVNLAQKEMTVYKFFLNHPEGISYPSMQDHRNEIYNIYRSFSDNDNTVTINNRVDSIITSTVNSLSELVSKLNKKLIRTVDSNIVSLYTIKYDDRGGPHYIEIDRSLVRMAH
ncbi:MAG: hypothetical protein ACM3NR_03175 [Methanosarcina sp.]